MNEPGFEGDSFLVSTGFGRIWQDHHLRKGVVLHLITALPLSHISVCLIPQAVQCSCHSGVLRGNCLIVCTIFTNAVHADELLSIMLHLGPHGSDNALRVAGVFMAINKSARRLRQLYDIDLPGVRTPSQQKTKALWPNPIANPPECTERPLKLEFFSKVNRPNRTELSFIYSDNERHAMYLPCTMQTRTSNQVVFCQVCHQVS